MARKDEKSKNDLEGWSRIIDESGDRSRKESEDLTRHLGEPDIFVPDTEHPAQGWGYWRVKNGIIKYRRSASGLYNRWDRQEIPNDEIERILKLKDMPSRGG